MLEVTKPKYGKMPQHTHPSDIQPIDPKLGVVNIARDMSLRDDLQLAILGLACETTVRETAISSYSN